MIRFENLPPDVAQSMCTPMHLILPPSAAYTSLPAASPSPTPAARPAHAPPPPSAPKKKLRPNAPTLGGGAFGAPPGMAMSPPSPFVHPGGSTTPLGTPGAPPGYRPALSPSMSVASMRGGMPVSPGSDGRLTTNAPGALYLGSLSAITDLDNLRQHRIGLLVQVLDVPWLPEEPTTVLGVRTHRLPLLDMPSADLKPHLEGTCTVIEKALSEGRNVLVHCQQGISRSSAIVIAYLICKHGLTYDQAFEFCRARRACVRPNDGFVACLREWEKQWRPRPPMGVRRGTVH